MAWALLLLAATARADSPEQWKAAADRLFLSPPKLEASKPAPRLPQDEEELPILTSEQKAEMSAFIRRLAGRLAERNLAPLARKDPTAYLKIDEIKNNNWRTSAQFPLNGKTATVGFSVSRAQEAYMSVLSQDAAVPPLVNIKGLLDGEKSVEVNGRAYAASLSPNIFDKMASKLRLKGHGESRSFKIRELLAATAEKGFPLQVGAQAYRVFYFDDVDEKGGFGQVQPARQNISFVLKDKDDYQIFIIPAEQVPTDQLAVYSLHNGARVGLQRLEDGKVLAARPNP